MRTYDYTNQQITPENVLIDVFLETIRYDKFSGKVGSSNYRCWIRDINIQMVVHPDMVVPNLAATGYKMPERWNRLLKEYLNINDLFIQLSMTKEAMDYQEGMYTFATDAKHTHGNCLIAATWNIPHQKKSTLLPRINLFSRSTFFVPVGILDFSLGILIGRKLLHTPRPFVLSWVISQLQLSAWMSLPFVHVHNLRPQLGFQEQSFTERLDWAQGHMGDPEYMERKFRFYNRWTKSTQRAMIAGEFRPTSIT
jgi:hypothetical protein